MDSQTRELVRAIHLHHTRNTFALLEALRERFGEGVVDVVTETESRIARAQWSAVGEAASDRSVWGLIAALWEPLRSKGMEFTATGETVDGMEGVRVTCVKCPFHDMAKETGTEAWMHAHTCLTDPVIAEAFNPDISLTRTETLMTGGTKCDFLYVLKKR